MTPKNYNVIINVQGDLPTIEPRLIAAMLDPFDTPEVDITTLAVQITQDRERTDPNVVKAVIALKQGLSADWSGTLFQPCRVPSSPDGRIIITSVCTPSGAQHLTDLSHCRQVD